jgi:hypothetical protein
LPIGFPNASAVERRSTLRNVSPSSAANVQAPSTLQRSWKISRASTASVLDAASAATSAKPVHWGGSSASVHRRSPNAESGIATELMMCRM